MRKITLLAISLFLFLNLQAVEYFISLDGNDSNTGTSESVAFKSIQKGVDILKPGDILTILPGEYLQKAEVKCSGTEEKPITIRGKNKKFCVLKGWENIDGKKFKPLENTKFVYAAEVEKMYNFIETDSGKMLDPAPSPDDMDFFRASYYYDKTSKRLYVHTSDGKSPEKHSFKITVMGGNLLNLTSVKNVIIKNLSFSGSAPENFRQSQFGFAIMTLKSENILIDNCDFHYNCGGYLDRQGLKNTIQNCRLSNNITLWWGEFAQIIFESKSSNCTAIDNIITDGGNHGLRFYGWSTDVRGIGNIVINDRNGLYYKCTSGKRLSERNVVDQCTMFNYSDLNHGRPITDLWNTFAMPSYVFDDNNTNLIFESSEKAKFCDTESLDYRLQSDSPFRKKGPDGKDAGAYQFEANVFFVSPDGNDSDDGLSVKSAFLTLGKASKELKAGVTLYLLPGIYKEELVVNAKGTKEKPIIIRSRGASLNASILSLTIENAENIKVEKLSISGTKVKNSRNITLERIYDTNGIKIVSSKNVQLGYSTIFSGAKIEKSSGIELYSSILDSEKGYLLEITQSPDIFMDYDNFINPENKFALFDKNELNSLDAMKKYIRGMRYCVSSSDCFKIVDGKPYLSPFSVCSGMDGKGMAIGAFAIWHDLSAAEITDVKVNYLSPSSASISWALPNTSSVLWRVREGWNDARPVLSCLKYGTTPDCNKKIISLGDVFNNVTVSGLEAGKKYYFRIEVPKIPEVWRAGEPFPLKMVDKFRKTWQAGKTEVFSFTTPENLTRPVCRNLYLSPKGLDSNDGLSRDTAWKSLKKASFEVRPGDTVILRDGVYEGTFRPIVSGLPDFKITLKAENCGSAVIDGSTSLRPCGVFLDLCSNVIIDGIIFENFSAKLFGNRAGMDYGQMEIARSEDITTRNCVFNTRGQYQTCAVLRNVSKIKFINNVFAFSPAQIEGSEIRNIEFNGNTFFWASIRNLLLSRFAKGSELIVKNNLFAGQNRQKVFQKKNRYGRFLEDAKASKVKVLCDYNAWYFSPTDPYNFCGLEEFPAALPKKTGNKALPYEFQGDEEFPEGSKPPFGIKRLQDKFGIEKNSIEIKELLFKSGIPSDYMKDGFGKLLKEFIDKNKNRFTLRDFELPDNSPLKNSGENGVRIGAGIPNTK